MRPTVNKTGPTVNKRNPTVNKTLSTSKVTNPIEDFNEFNAEYYDFSW
jgi:hypothetical protein